ncbi:hypothetical protein PC9H_000133 [Pleurotus ostreatus]|uniref:Clp1-like protein n=2 Tax=Pleurotus ostreatus TaxID=5322 RepID=A0A067P9L4_PLEO1|nr:uncharacterized protein PC9H_000133 [Pleurotus ostreatus]KAF7439797.1 hypothetical protein PC9H_000133 [Pleurotus ostreatus]KAJ8701033.1 hypothetical protein PTI98_003999 [Pleurotus ostreatus]KDQ32596.1 hypothetical protein PLEOSDRAFT_20238 [Pleurotus ostreatus PC15]
MFQVAAHPTSFDSHKHGHGHRSSHSSSQHYHQQPAVSSSVQLPRTLARPPFADISREALTAASPELANVPSEYIRRRLRDTAPQMMAGIASLAPSHLPSTLPRSHLPSSLSIPIRSQSSHSTQPSYPTHILAIAPSKPSSSHSADALTIVPTHALVLASQCALLPRFPASSSANPGSPQIQLPVIPVSLPSPAAFQLLHPFLYTHNLGALLASLLPMPQGFVQAPGFGGDHVKHVLGSGQKLHELSVYLCQVSHSLSALTSHAAHIKELWQDCVALGIYDVELWDAMDLAWEVVLGAMNLAARQ